MPADTKSPKGLVIFLVAIVCVAVVGTALVVNRMNDIVAQQTGQGSDKDRLEAGNLSIGDKLPNFTLQKPDGGQAHLSDFEDGEHFVVVNFTHPDCPCAESCSKLISEMGRAGYEDVQVVGILPVDYDDPRVIKALDKQRADGILTYPIFYDMGQKVMKELGAQRTPTVWVLDKQGVIRFWGAPENTLFRSATDHRFLLREAIDAMRKGETPPVQSFKPIGCEISLPDGA